MFAPLAKSYSMVNLNMLRLRVARPSLQLLVAPLTCCVSRDRRRFRGVINMAQTVWPTRRREPLPQRPLACRASDTRTL